MNEKEILEFTINEQANERLDKFVCDKTDVSRSLCKEMIEQGLVLVNNKKEKQSYKIKPNDYITIELPEVKEYEILPENLNLNIVYEDDDVAVVDKPYGMVVHPASGIYQHTLVNGLLYQLKNLSGINGVMRPGIVHRIDKDTSGLLMVAKNDQAHNSLSEQLAKKTVNRRYIALVYGKIEHDAGKINAPIGRDELDRKKMAVVEDGKEAVTNFVVLERFKDFTLVECRLETGRTHQIRVHFKYINHPLVGDPLYGPRHVIGDTGQFLHARLLGFNHPKTGEYLEFESPLPEYFTSFLEELRKRDDLVKAKF